MPDRNGLSLWAERDDEYHLRTTLQAFERSYISITSCDSNTDVLDYNLSTIWYEECQQQNIHSVQQLATTCRKKIMNELQEENNNNTNNNNNKNKNSNKNTTKTNTTTLWNDPIIVQSLSSFLPSMIGFQCTRLAKEAVERVENGLAKASYVHRGSMRGGEKWIISTTTFQKCALQNCIENIDADNNNDDDDVVVVVEKEVIGQDSHDKWILDCDCAGYVRNVIKTITGSDLLVSLSDRDYMRAKDFYTFFERLEYTVNDINRINPAEDEIILSEQQITTTTTTTTLSKWCRVDDLRSIIAGDIIVYRAKGSAAGGSVFTKKDCLTKALTAVKTAELYDIVDGETGDQTPVDINVSKLPEVREWVDDVMEILRNVGIEEMDQLRGDNNGENDEDNDDNLQAAINQLEMEGKFTENTVSLLQEVLSSNNGNTGHIMFAAGPAEETSTPNKTSQQETHIWRVPVYHSTGVGPKSKRGVQRAYKRFEYSPKYQKWTRGGPRDDVEGGHIEVVVGRMCI